jgi:phosphopantetheinyl transferase
MSDDEFDDFSETAQRKILPFLLKKYRLQAERAQYRRDKARYEAETAQLTAEAAQVQLRKLGV